MPKGKVMKNHVQDYLKRANKEIEDLKTKLGDYHLEAINQILLARLLRLEDEIDELTSQLRRVTDEGKKQVQTENFMIGSVLDSAS
jgi:hypothetical protein